MCSGSTADSCDIDSLYVDYCARVASFVLALTWKMLEFALVLLHVCARFCVVLCWGEMSSMLLVGVGAGLVA